MFWLRKVLRQLALDFILEYDYLYTSLYKFTVPKSRAWGECPEWVAPPGVKERGQRGTRATTQHLFVNIYIDL